MTKETGTKLTSKQRNAMLDANGFRCCVCHKGDRAFEVHHIDKNSRNSIPSNLAVLCKDDHSRIHSPAKYPRKLQLTKTAIRKHKSEWERFIRGVRKPKPQYVGAIFYIGQFECEHKNLCDLEALTAIVYSRSGRTEFREVFRREDGIDGLDGFERACDTIRSFNSEMAWLFCDDPIFPQDQVCECCRELGHEDKIGWPVLPSNIREDLLRDRGHI